MKSTKTNLLWVLILILVLIASFYVKTKENAGVAPDEIVVVQDYELKLKKAAIQDSDASAVRGYSRVSEKLNISPSEHKNFALKDFKDVMPLVIDGKEIKIFTGHQVYTGLFSEGYFYGAAPGSTITFIISGSMVIPVDFVAQNGLNKIFPYAEGMIYGEGEMERIYIVESEQEKDDAHDMYAKGKSILSGESIPEQGQIILDGRLLPCRWDYGLFGISVPMRELCKYLYTASTYDVNNNMTVVNSCSTNGVELKTQILPTQDTPSYLLEDCPIQNGQITMYSADTNTKDTFFLSSGSSCWTPIQSLNCIFGWDFYLDEDEKLLVIITDESNLTDNFIVKPSNE